MDAQDAKEYLESVDFGPTELSAIQDWNYHTLISVKRGRDGIKPSRPGQRFTVWDATKIALYFRLTKVAFPAKDAKYIVHNFLKTEPRPSVEDEAHGTYVALYVDKRHSPQITFFRPENKTAPQLLTALLEKGYICTAWNMTKLYEEVAEKFLAWRDRKAYRPTRSREAEEMIEAFRRVREGSPVEAK